MGRSTSISTGVAPSGANLYAMWRLNLLVLLMPVSLFPAELVRVVTVSQEKLSGKDLVDQTLERLESAASYKPDIAVLPETFTRGAAEAVSGPTTERLGAWARRHGSYVLFGLNTRRDGRVYNSALLLDRQGRLAGSFDKMHPTEKELEQGVQPGGMEPPVFDTDFGRIGVQICFDVNWWDNWRRLKEKGARIVFFPAAYPAALQTGAIALANQVYVVSSTWRGPSRVYDITGETLAFTGHFQYWAGATLPIGKKLFEVDFNAPKVPAILRKYGPRVEVNWLHDDDWFTLASRDPELSTEAVIREFGLTPLDAYRVRARQAVEKARR
jgi:beta-ureidopropionase